MKRLSPGIEILCGVEGGGGGGASLTKRKGCPLLSREKKKDPGKKKRTAKCYGSPLATPASRKKKHRKEVRFRKGGRSVTPSEDGGKRVPGLSIRKKVFMLEREGESARASPETIGAGEKHKGDPIIFLVVANREKKERGTGSGNAKKSPARGRGENVDILGRGHRKLTIAVNARHCRKKNLSLAAGKGLKGFLFYRERLAAKQYKKKLPVSSFQGRRGGRE